MSCQANALVPCTVSQPVNCHACGKMVDKSPCVDCMLQVQLQALIAQVEPDSPFWPQIRHSLRLTCLCVQEALRTSQPIRTIPLAIPPSPNPFKKPRTSSAVETFAAAERSFAELGASLVRTPQSEIPTGSRDTPLRVITVDESDSDLLAAVVPDELSRQLTRALNQGNPSVVPPTVIPGPNSCVHPSPQWIQTRDTKQKVLRRK